MVLLHFFEINLRIRLIILSACLEPVPLGRSRRWHYLVVRLYCLRHCRLAIDLMGQALSDWLT